MEDGGRQPVVVSARGVGAPHGAGLGQLGMPPPPPELSETNGVCPAPSTSAVAQRCFPGERQAVAPSPSLRGRTDCSSVCGSGPLERAGAGREQPMGGVVAC